MRSLTTPIFKHLNFLRSPGIRQAVAFMMAIVFFFLIITLLNRWVSGFDTLPHLILFMAVVMLIGLLNYLMLESERYENIPEWGKGGMTILGNLFGGLLFYLLAPKEFLTYYANLFLPAILLFSLPWFFITTVKAILAIPPLEYKPMQVTNLKDIVAEIDWAENEEKGIVWDFENVPEMGNRGHYWVRTHTPHGVSNMRLRELFKGLLSLHNHNLSPGKPIHFENGEEFFGWRFFYETSNWLWQKRKPLDPNLTLRENGVWFHQLSRKERREMNDLRQGLSKKFKTTRLIISRTNIKQPVVSMPRVQKIKRV